MSMSDPIADLLTRIRNAQMVAKVSVSVSPRPKSRWLSQPSFER